MTAPKPSVFGAAVGQAVLLHSKEQQEQTTVFVHFFILTPLFISLLVDLMQGTPWEPLCMVIINSL